MPPTSSIAVVLEGGLVQAFIVQDWPAQLALPRVVIVDHDTEGADREELTSFRIGPDAVEAFCRGEDPLVYTSQADVLSPRAVLAALGEPVADEAPELLALARSVRQGILDLDAEITAAERSPTGDDYNDIYLQANSGPIDVLKALGDPTDFRR